MSKHPKTTILSYNSNSKNYQNDDTIKQGVPELVVSVNSEYCLLNGLSLWYIHIDAMTNKTQKQKINYNEKRERN